jgi:hypothetical protein
MTAAISSVGGVSSAVEVARPFKSALDAARPTASPAVAPTENQPLVIARSNAARSSPAVEAAAVSKLDAGQMIDQVNLAQKRLDEVLRLAQSGKSFSPAELLALQANVYQASCELDLAGKVVEKGTSGVKQVLQTQI